MTEKEKKTKAEFDFGLGGLSRGLGNLFELVSRMVEEGKEEYHRSGEISGLGDRAKGIYGFSVRMGIGGQPTVESFGNIKKTARGAVEVAEVREPIVDVFDEGDHLVVIAEMPGIDEADLRLEIRDDILDLKTEKGDRKYRKEVLLPAEVEAESRESYYKSGILEIKLRKKK